MSTEIGFGIVGAGMVARYHAHAIAETPGARLAAVCRADATRAAEAAAELGVPCEASLQALLDRPDVDAVCLCSPSGLHAEQAVAAARGGQALAGRETDGPAPRRCRRHDRRLP